MNSYLPSKSILCKLGIALSLTTTPFGITIAQDLKENNTMTTNRTNSDFNSNTLPYPPNAEKRPSSTEHHGITLKDDYAWLRDKDWKNPESGVTDPAIMAYIQAENAYTDSFFQPLEGEVDQLFKQWKGYIPEVTESLKMKRDSYFYFSRQHQSDNYPTYLRQKDEPGASEEVYLDVNKEAQAHAFYHVGGSRVSPDHLLLALSEDTTGNEFHTLQVREIGTNHVYPERLTNVAGSIIWNPDSTGFYYLKHTDSWHTLYVYYHALNTPQEQDILIFEEKDSSKSVGIGRTLDKKYLLIESGTKEDEELYFLDLTAEKSSVSLLSPRIPNRHLSATHHEGYFYLTTDDTGPNRRLVRVPVADPQAPFEELIPHDPHAYLTSFEAFKSHFVLSFKKDGLEHVAVMDPQSRALTFIPIESACYDLSVLVNQYDDNHFWYELSSIAQPATTYKVTFGDLAQEIVKKQEVPGFDQSLYTVERHWAEARDGTKVPISLAYRKDKFTPGVTAAPVLLYGYGSYGYGMSPYFGNRGLAYMDNGFIYAIAHIRGGDDLGYQWYLDGKYLKKKNTFHDFIDCGRYLIANNYAKPGQISAMGGSAGGMLMGYIANNAADVFNGIAALVPFVDIMNTMLDKSLPLTEGEFLEWGNPIESAEYFSYMLDYSPYDNVHPQNYPAMLITGGLTDPRVTYWEPTKWIAKLREYNTGEAALLLKMIMAGHGGGSKRDEVIREQAEILAFFKYVNGLV